MTKDAWNSPLIGKSTSEFLATGATPSLCLDLDIMQRNIATMQTVAKRYKKGLRPHMKAHKSGQIGAMQREAGALGISCTTAKEAMVAAEAGLTGILITTPIVTPLVLKVLATIKAEFIFTVDSLISIERLAATGVKAGVIIDLGVGQNRTGVSTVDEAYALASHAGSYSNLTVCGIQAYYGHLQHVPGYDLRREQVETHWEFIETVRKALGSEIVTGGGSGTHLFDLANGPFTEIQPGSYLFMDSQYCDVEIGTHFDVSLTVLSRVTSATKRNQVVIDAGAKSMSTDVAVMRFLNHALRGATHRFMGDEHSAITVLEGAQCPSVGEPIQMVTTHCDPTVNLYDVYHVFSSGRLLDIWPVQARGY